MQEPDLPAPLIRPRWAFIGPYLKQAKGIAWEYLKTTTKELPGREVYESGPFIRWQGREWWIFGADNPDGFRGWYFNGAVCDEYQDWRPSAYTAALSPGLVDAREECDLREIFGQGWVIKAGTTKGRNLLEDDFDRVKKDSGMAWRYPWHKTKVFSEAAIERQRAKMPPSDFAREWNCDPDAPVEGAYYGDLMYRAEVEGRITDLPYLPQYPVHTWWDIGIGDDTVIWFVQIVGSWIHVISCISDTGKGLPHWAEELRKPGYNYAMHWWPHDGGNNEWGMGQTRRKTAYELGLKPVEVVERGDKQQGREAVRLLLPVCKFDREKCRDGIAALKSHTKRYDQIRRTWADEEFRDWTRHHADAFRTGAVVIQDVRLTSQRAGAELERVGGSAAYRPNRRREEIPKGVRYALVDGRKLQVSTPEW